MMAGIHENLVRSAFWARHGWSGMGKALRFLRRSQWLPADQVREFQWARLKKMLEHACGTVPYYRAVFERAGATPADISSVEDMARLPTLTKAIIQERLSDLISSAADRRRLIENHTGGSTGEPLMYYQDRHYYNWAMAEKMRCYMISGWAPGRRWAFFWGSIVEGRQHEGWKRISDRLLGNYIWVNTLGITEAQLWDAFRRLERFRPELVVGYVSSMNMLCDFIRGNGLEGRLCPPKVQTSAEVLTPADRARIQDTLQCEVFDRYGGRECSNLAHECEAHDGLHLLSENNLVEIVNGDRPARPGESGRIVVTNLTNFGMPFIRYEQGDVGVPSARTCSCGRGLPLLESVQGRTYGNVVCPSGKIIYGHTFTMLFYKPELAGAKKFQVIQHDVENITLRLALLNGVNPDEFKAKLLKAIHERIDPGFRVAFELCDDIPALKSGKHQYIISHVPAPFMPAGEKAPGGSTR